jgi:transposase
MEHLHPILTEDKKDQLIAQLIEENQLLREQVNFFKQQAEQFKQQAAQLQKQVEELQYEVAQLRQQLALQKNGRSSKTSSTPPSQDIGRSNQRSLRPPSTRKTGGQQGHEGMTLEMVQQPDQIITHSPEYCQGCGEKLDTESATLLSRRQEIIIPPIKPQYIEHQSYSCKCSKCGQVTISQSPGHLKANIQYGAGVNALVGYLSARHYVPMNRLAEIMRDVFCIPMSEGTVANILKSLAEKALPVYERIKNRVGQSSVVGSDETGIKINGRKGWLYTFQTTALTYLTTSFSRGFDAIESLFKNGFPVSVYVTDCWAAQLKTFAKAHQICMAHLMRELTNFVDALSCQWSEQMKQLIEQALQLKKELTADDYLNRNEKVQFLEAHLDLLLEQPLDRHQKVNAFIKRLNKNRNAIFTFLHHPKVPPDNNASERAIRTAKVKMKISNQFKSFEGAQCFAVLRSVIDTTIKNSQNVLSALTNLAAC